MKMVKIIPVFFILIVLTAAATHAQQQFTHTVTAKNKYCNSTCSLMDIPDLNNNPIAIIFVTPIIENGRNLNPHPTGVYFAEPKKWSIINLDGTTIGEGAKFSVQYYPNPDSDRFVFVVPKTGNAPCIDDARLNGNPHALIRFSATGSPRGAYFNREDFKFDYDASALKWCIPNINDKPVRPDTAYNIAITSAGGNVNANSRIPKNLEPEATPRDTAKVAIPAETSPVIQPSQPVPLPKTAKPNDSAKVAIPPQTGPPLVHDWTLHPEPPLTIPANAQILLFIHGMDSRAEEAGDITRALFTLIANKPGSPAATNPPVSAPSQNSQMVVLLQGLLEKYKGCILERYETQQDLRNRGLDGNLSGLLNRNGLLDRDSVGCVAGNICSRASRLASYGALQAQASRGDTTNFQNNLERAIPKDCFNCQKHQEWHTKHVHCTMEAGGNSGFQGAYFEGCKAGMDLEKLANDVGKDISAVIRDIAGIRLPDAQVTGGPSIATNYSTVHFTSCQNPAGGCPEDCDYPDKFLDGKRTGVLPYDKENGQQVQLYFAPDIPRAMLDADPPPNRQFNIPAAQNIGQNEGRLRSELRDAAKNAKPRESLRLATYRFAAGDSAMGKAYADLSVTGHLAFAEFRKEPPNEKFCQSLISQRPSQLSEDAVLTGCEKALDRAYAVANFLRAGQRGDTPATKTKKTAERKALGWIAVSGEDDSPHRPVNVPSSDFPQYDVEVKVPLAAGSNNTLTVRTRYVIAESPATGNGAKPLVVISLDLPTSGYSENIDYQRISALSEIGNPTWTPLPVPVVVPFELLFAIPNLPPVLPPGFIIPAGTPLPDFKATGKTPLLDFIENFIVRFTETVDQKVPIKNNIKAVMGGSLGGNMTFRLGRRAGVPWLPKFIVWSPASIWDSLGGGADLFKHFGPRSAWESANAASTAPTARDRAGFFGSWDKPIAGPIIREAQSDTWTSEYYPCKKSAIAAARLDRHETYDANFLAWHWRLGAEQLLYSHQSIDPTTNRPRFMSNQKPMLLACGTEDQVPYNEICPATQKTAPFMTLTPGKALFLDKTGHSLDNERRIYFARQIIEFLGL